MLIESLPLYLKINATNGFTMPKKKLSHGVVFLAVMSPFSKRICSSMPFPMLMIPFIFRFVSSLWLRSEAASE